MLTPQSQSLAQDMLEGVGMSADVSMTLIEVKLTLLKMGQESLQDSREEFTNERSDSAV